MKGTMFDLLFMTFVLLTLAVTILISYVIIDEFNTQASAMGMNTTATESSMTALGIFNYGYIIVLIGLVIGIIVSAFLIPSHPAFVIVGIVMMIIASFLAIQVSNVYYDFVQDPAINTIATSNFDIMSWVMLNLPFIIVGIGTLLIIVMYSRSLNRGIRL